MAEEKFERFFKVSREKPEEVTANGQGMGPGVGMNKVADEMAVTGSAGMMKNGLDEAKRAVPMDLKHLGLPGADDHGDSKLLPPFGKDGQADSDKLGSKYTKNLHLIFDNMCFVGRKTGKINDIFLNKSQASTQPKKSNETENEMMKFYEMCPKA